MCQSEIDGFRLGLDLGLYSAFLVFLIAFFAGYIVPRFMLYVDKRELKNELKKELSK